MKASQLIFDATNPYNYHLSEIEVNDVKTNSQLIEKNDLFVAIKGHSVDGHRFIQSVVEKEASLIIADEDMKNKINPDDLNNTGILFVENTYDYLSTIMNRFLDYPSQKLNVFGITGTNGKTSTANILAQLLNHSGKNTGLIGTNGIFVVDKKLDTQNTTPDPLVLQTVFSKMLGHEVENVIMEVSSIGVVENRVKETDFSVAVFTNFSQDHLDFHGTMENYLKAKLQFFKELNPRNSRGKENFAIINLDDEQAKHFIANCKATIRTYGFNNNADYYVTDINFSHTGTTFTLHHENKDYFANTPLVGEFNVYNALAAIAAAHTQEIDLKELVSLLENVHTVPGRLETVSNPSEDDITVIVDFAHTPDGLEKALQSVKRIKHHQIISVFGCGGDRDATKRPIMAQIGVQQSDFAIFTSDNPRTEDPEKILEEMIAGITSSNYLDIVNRKEAIYYAIKHAKPKDIILIAGKGDEDYQIIGTEKFDFDDRKVAKEALALRRSNKKI